MNTLQKHARFLQILSIFCIPFLLVFPLGKWFLGYFPLNATTTWISGMYGNWTNASETIAPIPFEHRMLCCIIESIGMLIACGGIITFISLCKHLQTGKLFSSYSIQALKKLSMIALAWVVYNPINTALLSVITSWHKGPGNRVLTVGFGTSDLINIIVFSSLVIVMLVLQEGAQLKQEHDLTV